MDLEVRSLVSLGGIQMFLDALAHRLHSQRDFERLYPHSRRRGVDVLSLQDISSFVSKYSNNKGDDEWFKVNAGGRDSWDRKGWELARPSVLNLTQRKGVLNQRVSAMHLNKNSTYKAPRRICEVRVPCNSYVLSATEGVEHSTLRWHYGVRPVRFIGMPSDVCATIQYNLHCDNQAS
ncbi:hypothetical protein C8Q74DRAFT_87302 [Fomes fomentarius]|nr:hypothetical protein C8Q74DRAFT_87302 [Fomes fomentarius]